MSGVKIRNGGFTIVEIMIVVTVIGILSLILTRNYIDIIKRSHKTTCVMNLRSIEAAKAVWSLTNPESSDSSIEMSDLVEAYLKEEPRCPSGGEYTIGEVGELATCSVEGHTISDE